MSGEERPFPQVERVLQPYEGCALCGEAITGTGLLVVGVETRFLTHDACVQRVLDRAMGEKQ